MSVSIRKDEFVTRRAHVMAAFHVQNRPINWTGQVNRSTPLVESVLWHTSALGSGCESVVNLRGRVNRRSRIINWRRELCFECGRTVRPNHADKPCDGGDWLAEHVNQDDWRTPAERRLDLLNR